MGGVLYLEQTVAGVKWRRYSGIAVSNPYAQQPMIGIMAENVLLVDNDQRPLTLARDNINVPFDPTGVIQLRNPETDELLGTSITQAEIYAILYSVCRELDAG